MTCEHNWELMDLAADFQKLVCTKCWKIEYNTEEIISNDKRNQDARKPDYPKWRPDDEHPVDPIPD